MQGIPPQNAIFRERETQQRLLFMPGMQKTAQFGIQAIPGPHQTALFVNGDPTKQGVL